MGAGTDFLTALFGAELPGTTAIQLWTLKTRKSTYLASARAGDPTIKSLGLVDVYVAAGLAPKKLAANKRCDAKNIAGIGALWMDVDVNGGPDEKTGAAPSIDAAVALCTAVAPPSLVVLTGGGCQPWWLLDEPLLLRNDVEREALTLHVQTWQGVHRAIANTEGWTVDYTHDLARLMRPPGTINGKGGQERPVELHPDFTGAQRYSLDELRTRTVNRRVASSGPAPSGRRATDNGLVIADDAEPPIVLFEALQQNSELFNRTWRHARKDNGAGSWSLSEYDLSLASQAMAAGWSDQQVVDLLVFHRNRYEPGGTKQLRLDYLERTVTRAHASARREEAEKERVEAIEDIEAIDQSGETPTAAITFELFNRIIASGIEGAPEVIRLRQFGTAADLARFILTVRHEQVERDISLGDIHGLLIQARFNASIAVETGHVVSTVRQANWQSAVRVLLRQRELVIEEEDTREGDVAELIRLYLERRGVPKRSDDALHERAPFTEGGRVYLHMRSFHRFVGMSTHGAPTKSDLLVALRGLGFERTTLAFHDQDVGRTSVSYWSAPLRGLPPAGVLGDRFELESV